MKAGTSKLRGTLDRQVDRIERLVDNLRALDGRARLDYLVGRARKGRMMLKRKLLWRKNQFDLKFAAATGQELPKDLQRNHKAIDHALKSYRPRPFDGAVTLFRAARQPFGAVPNATLGWETVVRGAIDVYEVPGRTAPSRSTRTRSFSPRS